jgi:chemotaxis protein CheC
MEADVALSVSHICMVEKGDISKVIDSQVKGIIGKSIVEQFFLGKITGTSILMLPESEGKNLCLLFCPTSDETIGTDEYAALYRETILEIGNILIGACVGMIAELLGKHVSFHPPHYVNGTVDRLLIDEHMKNSGKCALIFKMNFLFAINNIQGSMFIITSNETINWMKNAIDET